MSEIWLCILWLLQTFVIEVSCCGIVCCKGKSLRKVVLKREMGPDQGLHCTLHSRSHPSVCFHISSVEKASPVSEWCWPECWFCGTKTLKVFEWTGGSATLQTVNATISCGLLCLQYHHHHKGEVHGHQRRSHCTAGQPGGRWDQWSPAECAQGTVQVTALAVTPGKTSIVLSLPATTRGLECWLEL